MCSRDLTLDEIISDSDDEALNEGQRCGVTQHLAKVQGEIQPVCFQFYCSCNPNGISEVNDGCEVDGVLAMQTCCCGAGAVGRVLCFGGRF